MILILEHLYMSGNENECLNQVSLLAVDSDTTFLETLGLLLKGLLQELHTASSGQEAILTFSRFSPDLVLCGTDLRDMDGLKLARSIRELDDEASVLLMSATEDLPPLQEAFAAGIVRYVPKPLEEATLLPVLQECACRILRLKGLETEHRRNAMLLDGLPSPSMLLSQDCGTVITANPAARKLGFSPGSPCSGEFFPEAVLQAFFPRGCGGQELGVPRAEALQLDVKAHERHWEVTYAPIAANTLLFSAIDVTQRVRAQQELRQSSLFLQQVINTVQTPIMVKDKELRYLTANDAFCTLLGAPREQILGKRTDAFLDPEVARPIIEEERKVFEEGTNVSEHSMTDFHGVEHIIIAQRGVFAHPASGEPVMVVALNDVTAQRQMEKLREDVERITRHDLKTPLSASISLPELIMEEGGCSETQVEYLMMIREAGQRMLSMINSSLDLYKMERGVYQLAAVPVDLPKVTRQVAKDLQQLATALRVKVVVTKKLPARDNTAKACLARGEEMLCYSLLANLLRNAIEACPKGEAVTIDLDCEAPPPMVALHNPQPVPEEIREHFFEKYATFGKSQGTGLGTYSAKLMAQTLNGSLNMTTDERSGTTLTLRLPPWE